MQLGWTHHPWHSTMKRQTLCWRWSISVINKSCALSGRARRVRIASNTMRSLGRDKMVQRDVYVRSKGLWWPWVAWDSLELDRTWRVWPQGRVGAVWCRTLHLHASQLSLLLPKGKEWLGWRFLEIQAAHLGRYQESEPIHGTSQRWEWANERSLASKWDWWITEAGLELLWGRPRIGRRSWQNLWTGGRKLQRAAHWHWQRKWRFLQWQIKVWSLTFARTLMQWLCTTWA